jgi:hypothetical protein
MKNPEKIRRLVDMATEAAASPDIVALVAEHGAKRAAYILGVTTECAQQRAWREKRRLEPLPYEERKLSMTYWAIAQRKSRERKRAGIPTRPYRSKSVVADGVEISP